MGNFTPTTKAALKAPLDPKHVSDRNKSGMTLHYVEGWHVIAEANRIFGFDGWTRETVDMLKCGEPEQVNGKWRVRFMCKARVTVGDIIREGTGYGSGIAADLGDAYEGAIKEAETDAMKRAFMTFGNPFGLALYDKSRENVRADDGRLPKGQARTAATEINNLLDTANTVEEIDARWSSIEQKYIGKLPADWEPALQTKYETNRENLKAKELA